MRTTERLGSSRSAARTICTIVVAGAVGLTGGCGDRDPDPPDHDAPEPIVAIEAGIPTAEALASLAGSLEHPGSATPITAEIIRTGLAARPWSPSHSARPMSLDRLRDSLIAEPPGIWWSDLPPDTLPAPWPEPETGWTVWCGRLDPLDGRTADFLMLRSNGRRNRWSIAEMKRVSIPAAGGDPIWDSSAWLVVHDETPVMQASQGMIDFATWVDVPGAEMPVVELESSHGGTAFPGGLLEWWLLDDQDPRPILDVGGDAQIGIEQDGDGHPRAMLTAMLTDCGAGSVMVTVRRRIDPSGDRPAGIPEAPTPPPSDAQVVDTVDDMLRCLGDVVPEDFWPCNCNESAMVLTQWCVEGHAGLVWTTLRASGHDAGIIAAIGRTLQSMLDRSETCRPELEHAPRWTDA